jgi:NAD(P)-dependent dehydrogenase (short-subunit alcohol dehydrogenase family)
MPEFVPPTYPARTDGASLESAAPMHGRVCAITGANRGIGRAAAFDLARMGATVLLLCRDASAGLLARDGLRASSGNPRIELITVDLASMRSIRTAAQEIRDRVPALHVLVNNAGINLPRRATSEEGFEMTLAVNHLGPFLLTTLLLPLLQSSAPSRIVTVTSEFERFGRIDFSDLQSERWYNGLRAYVRSKLANVLFAYALASSLEGTTVVSNCVYPGLVATDLMRHRAWWRATWLRPLWNAVFLSPEQGAGPLVFGGAAPKAGSVSGRCFGLGGRELRTSRRSYDQGVQQRLWRVSAELTGAA